MPELLIGVAPANVGVAGIMDGSGRSHNRALSVKDWGRRVNLSRMALPVDCQVIKDMLWLVHDSDVPVNGVC